MGGDGEEEKKEEEVNCEGDRTGRMGRIFLRVIEWSELEGEKRGGKDRKK